MYRFRAQYVLTDRGLSSKEFIQTMRQIKNHALHVVCGVRKDTRQYTYHGKKLDAQALHASRKKAGHAKRCRKLHTRYFDVVVPYEGVGDVTLYRCRFPYQKQWRLFRKLLGGRHRVETTRTEGLVDAKTCHAFRRIRKLWGSRAYQIPGVRDGPKKRLN